MDSYLYLLVKAVITLAFVLALFSAALWAFRRYMTGGAGKMGKAGKRFSNPLRVLTTSGLGQKKNLAIVEVAGEYLVLGVTPNTITCLTKIERAESLEELKVLSERAPGFFLNLFN